MTMTDWMSAFDGLDYPGRKKPVNRTVKQKEEKAPDWHEKPIKFMVGGVQREFYTIRHIAAALGYSVQSIRTWENSRLLPKSRYRAPAPRKSGSPAHITKGRRLWTREQIEGILRIASEEGVILNKKPPTARFAVRVQALFNELFDPSEK